MVSVEVVEGAVEASVIEAGSAVEEVASEETEADSVVAVVDSEGNEREDM